MASIGYAILTDIQAILQAVAYVGINTEEIKIRELPAVNETLDHVPCVCICPYHKIDSAPMGMEGSAGRTYAVEVCLIDGSDGDYATDQEKRQTWHEQTLNAIDKMPDGQFRAELPNVPSVWHLEIQEAPTFDRSKLSKLYSYQSVVVNFLSSE